jgi:hypothetical protein
MLRNWTKECALSGIHRDLLLGVVQSCTGLGRRWKLTDSQWGTAPFVRSPERVSTKSRFLGISFTVLSLTLPK